MAKDQSHLADLTIDDEKSWLTNLLAEEAVWDRRTLWQLGSWAAGSVGALVIAVLSVHASSDMRREQVAALDLSRQAQQLQTSARDGAVVNRQLASQIETLNGDRDRLYARITVLEQGLDSVTGAVARQSPPSSLALSSAAQALAVPPPLISAPATIAAIEAAQPVQAETPTQATLMPIAPAAPTSPPAPAGFTAHAATPAPATPTQTPAQTAAQSPAQTPAEAALASTMPHGPMAPAAKQLLPSSTVYAPPDPGAPQLDTRPTALPVMAKGDSKGDSKSDNQVDARAAPKTDAKTELKADLKPDSGSEAKSAGKTDRPVTSSFIPKSNPADPPPPVATPAHAATATATPVPEVPVLRTDFGVDLGTANSVEGLRALWQGLLKSDASLLSSLRPIMVIKERGNGLGMQLRLVAGPLTDAAAAAKICAVLAESDRGCETAVFDGQRLSVKTDVAEEPVTTSAIPKAVPGKPRYYTRRVRHEAYRPRAQAPPAAAPPPPASSSSSFLPGFLRH